jgi:hypothetical protein
LNGGEAQHVHHPLQLGPFPHVHLRFLEPLHDSHAFLCKSQRLDLAIKTLPGDVTVELRLFQFLFIFDSPARVKPVSANRAHRENGRASKTLFTAAAQLSRTDGTSADAMDAAFAAMTPIADTAQF